MTATVTAEKGPQGIWLQSSHLTGIVDGPSRDVSNSEMRAKTFERPLRDVLGIRMARHCPAHETQGWRPEPVENLRKYGPSQPRAHARLAASIETPPRNQLLVW